MRTTIDCYGYNHLSVDYLSRKRMPFDVEETDTRIYIRFSTQDVGPIHCIQHDESGHTFIRWAFGSWANRANLTYAADLNTPIEIDI